MRELFAMDGSDLDRVSRTWECFDHRSAAVQAQEPVENALEGFGDHERRPRDKDERDPVQVDAVLRQAFDEAEREPLGAERAVLYPAGLEADGHESDEDERGRDGQAFEVL